MSNQSSDWSRAWLTLDLQVDFLPSYKIHPLLQGALPSERVTPSPSILAVSFPLLQSFNQDQEQYDPGSAAAVEWPAQLLQSGISATVTRLNQHHVKIWTSHSLQACTILLLSADLPWRVNFLLLSEQLNVVSQWTAYFDRHRPWWTGLASIQLSTGLSRRLLGSCTTGRALQ